MSELKKCPFCNKELEQKGNFFFKHPTDGECILSNFSVCNRLKDIEAWNTRKPVDAVVEALKKTAFPDFEEEYTCNGEELLYLNDAIQIVKEHLEGVDRNG